jgi:hypothetical protein
MYKAEHGPVSMLKGQSCESASIFMVQKRQSWLFAFIFWVGPGEGGMQAALSVGLEVVSIVRNLAFWVVG